MSAEDHAEPPGDAADESEEFEARKRQRTELEQSDPYKDKAPADGADAAGAVASPALASVLLIWGRWPLWPPPL